MLNVNSFVRKNTLIILLIVLLFACQLAPAAVFQGEKIIYAISPVGKSEYNDLGLVDYRGKKCWLVTFHTRLTGFNDLEKIYADPQTGLPLTVERYIRWPLSEEFLIEEYSPQTNSLIIRQFLKNKLANEYKYKSDGPYHNAILLPFYLRQLDNINIGWSMVVRLPDVFTVTLDKIEDIKVNGNKITAYHFTSTPHKFEIWVSKDQYRLPVIIKGMAGYSMLMQSHSEGKK